MITTKPYGKMPDGRPVTAYTLTNAKGSSVTVLDMGVTLVSIHVPDRDGKLTDVLLGYDSAEGYLAGDNHIGGTIGRFAGRITKGQFTLDGKTYQLTINDNGNSLHGGSGMDFKLWQARQDGENALVMTYVSPEGEDGYPGTMTVTVRLSFDDDSALKFDYTATTDKPTICNLTNHAYFNFNSLKSDVSKHVLWLDADVYTTTDKYLIPLEEKPVAGTQWDFRKAKPLGEAVHDLNYILNKNSDLRATLYDPDTGIFMETLTNAPSMVVYDSVMLPDQADKGGKRHGKGSGVCLEAQLPPDSPNHERYKDYPYVLRPGETWKSWTVYRFSVK